MTKSERSHHAKKSGWILPTLFALAAFIMLTGLGSWQLERKAWKEGVIATLNARLAAPPMPVPPPAEWKNLDAAQLEYRRITTPLEFLHDQEALVYTPGSAFRPDIKSIGYWVLTPARLPGGSIVVVNRGFVPLDKKAASTRTEGLIGGVVDISGTMRWPEERGLFTPADEPQNNIWFVRDQKLIGAAKKWGAVAPFIIDLEQPAPPGGWPSPGKLEVHLRNNHFEYALTWFGLALTLVGVYAAFMIGRIRRRPSASL